MKDQYYISSELNWVYIYKVTPTGKKDPVHNIPEYKVLSIIEHGDKPTEDEVGPVSSLTRGVGGTIYLLDYDLYTKDKLIFFVFEDLIDLM
jgi:hypothetical protein